MIIYVIENSSSNGCAQSNENVPFYGKPHYNTFRARTPTRTTVQASCPCVALFSVAESARIAENLENAEWVMCALETRKCLDTGDEDWLPLRFYFCCFCYVEFRIEVSSEFVLPHKGSSTNFTQIDRTIYWIWHERCARWKLQSIFYTLTHFFEKVALNVLPNAVICVGTAAVWHRKCCRATFVGVLFPRRCIATQQIGLPPAVIIIKIMSVFASEMWLVLVYLMQIRANMSRD